MKHPLKLESVELNKNTKTDSPYLPTEPMCVPLVVTDLPNDEPRWAYTNLIANTHNEVVSAAVVSFFPQSFMYDRDST